MKKRHFIVSNTKCLWPEKEKNQPLFLTSPYISNQLQSENQLDDYSIYSPTTFLQQPSQKDADFIDLKYQQYLPILSDRLNTIHQTSFSQDFWQRALSLGLIRYITFVQQAFNTFEHFFNPDEFSFHTLSEKSFYTPLNFDDLRTFLQYQELGIEQLFSIYVDTFHPNLEKESREVPPQKTAESSPNRPAIKKPFIERLKNLNGYGLPTYFIQKIHKAQNTRVGFAGAYISRNHLQKLVTQTFGKINLIPVNHIHTEHTQLDLKARDKLSAKYENADKFDLFFLSTIPAFFPQLFLENFETAMTQSNESLKNYPNLKYVISEAWMSNSNLSFFLATANQKGIKHIYNEHNSLFHPWEGNLIKHRSQLVDIYFNMGWDTKNTNGIIKGSSLFAFSKKEKGKPTKQFKASYIAATHFARAPEISSQYAFCGEYITSFQKFTTEFLAHIPSNILSQILYRGPRSDRSPIKKYDKSVLLAPYITEMNNSPNQHLSGKEIMLNSGIVIFDYVATGYLESLNMNIPTIVLFNQDIYRQKHEFKDTFAPLIQAGIFQTNPTSAAKFVSEIIDNPLEWWESSSTQSAIKQFLKDNFGHPDVALNYYKELTKH